MSDVDKGRAKRPAKRSDPRALTRFVEELSWLLSSYADLDFKALGEMISEMRYADRATLTLRNRAAHREPTANFLVGILPSLFTDERLFPSNEDIVEFSQATLGIGIPRWQKKSKYELIGHIVCHTEQAEPRRVEQLVQALAELVDEQSAARASVQKQRLSGLSWNEVIQKLLRAQ